METFTQLLSKYINRIGVSDAELARRLGVSRQTIFRWREGATRRPRHREDVIGLANKLRLEPQERVSLLLAAGFNPEEPIEATWGLDEDQRAVAPVGLPETGQVEAALLLDETKSEGVGDVVAVSKITYAAALMPLRRRLPRLWWIVALAGALSLTLVLIIATGLWGDIAAGLGFPVDTISSTTAWPQTAAPDETLVLISEFTNYAGEHLGYNVASRLQEALQEEFREAGLENVRIERLPEIVTDEASAEDTGQELGAALVVWGEYDSGRVIAVTTALVAEEQVDGRERRWLIATSEELSSTINTDLPRDVQWISLYVLGQVHYWAGRWHEAEVVFERALIEPPEDRGAVARIYFFLGLLESREAASNLDVVIAYYTEAVERRPELISALNNRGVAYLQRGSVGDLDRAEADFRQVMTTAPDFSLAMFHLAITLLQQDPGNLEEALYLLEEAEGIQPELVSVQNGLCWYYSLAGRPNEALPHCNHAVELDPSGFSNDSRGLALTLLGRYEEAAAEFRFFLEILLSEDFKAYNQFATTRQAWIEALETGQNPFDEAILQALLQE